MKKELSEIVKTARVDAHRSEIDIPMESGVYMEWRKPIKGEQSQILVIDDDGLDIASQLHSALDEMLNPWRPVSELPKIGGAYWVIEKGSDEPLSTIYSTMNCRFYYEESYLMHITHWKPVLSPTPPKDI